MHLSVTVMLSNVLLLLLLLLLHSLSWCSVGSGAVLRFMHQAIQVNQRLTC